MKKLTDVKKLTPAFDGNEGWLTIIELCVIDPAGLYRMRFGITKEWVAPDGTIFVYAKPIQRN